MPSKFYVHRAGVGVVPVEEAPARESFHFVHGDAMTPTWHPVDGQIYDSKSNFRIATKQAGCVEVGNELLSQRKRESPVKSLSESGKKVLWDKIERAYHSKD